MKFRDIDEDVIAHVKNCEYCQNLVHQSFDNCCIPVGGKEFVELTYEVDKFFSHTVGCRTCSEILNEMSKKVTNHLHQLEASGR